EVCGDVEESRQHNVAELARAALDEGERVAVELPHVAHDAPALRAFGHCDGDHDRYSSRLRFRLRSGGLRIRGAACGYAPRFRGRASHSLRAMPHQFRNPKSAAPQSDFDEALAHEVALAADADGCYLVAASFDSNSDEAWSAHLDSLLADDLGCGVACDKSIADEIAAERPARAARRGVFRDAECGREHPAVY